MTEAGSFVREEPFVSLVVPVYEEEEVLPFLLQRLRTVAASLAGGYEILFVDDGSEDRTSEILARACGEDPRIQVLQLSRNFGQAAAITAGLDVASGDAVVLMDADLQDPPELVPAMIALYRQGFDVVHARRAARHEEGIFKRGTAWLFYRSMRLSRERALEASVGEFRLVSREVVEVLRGLREHHRLVRGLVAWVGFRQTSLPFERPGRAAGETKFPLRKMVQLGLDGMTSFSAAPLRVATVFGFLAILFGAGYAAYAVYIGYLLGLGVPGWTSLVILNVFFSGVVLVCLGLVGEYVGRIFEEVKGRPLYVVRGRVGGTGSPAAARGTASSDRRAAGRP